MSSIVVPVEESTQVAEARRRALALAGRLGFDENRASVLGLAVTEAATNLLKHGGGGMVIARTLVAGTAAGVEVLVIDSGRGMQSVAQSRVDGHSTSGSPGLGLGSIGRMAVNFDIYTQVSQGTALRFEVWPTAAAPPADPEIELGVVAMAKPGEEVNGDAWHLHSRRGRHMLVIVDGLGHGPAAATAARVAINSALERPELSPQDQLERMHGALRPTRGAAASVASLVPSRGTGSFCGIGNVGCVVRTAGRSRGLVVHNGTLGHQVRKLQAYDFPFEAGAALIMHTDGLTTSWNLDTYPGLEHRHAGLVAAVLFRDCRRRSDDVTVAVLKNRIRPP